MSQSTQRSSDSSAGKSQPSTTSAPASEKSSVTKQVTQQAKDLTEQDQDQVAQAKAVGEKKIREATESVKATGRDYVQQKKSQAAAEVGVFRDVVQKAADKLCEEDHQGVASYVSAAAEQLDRLRESIEQRNVGDLFGEAQRVARKHPEVVYGGLFVAGLALMRFLKASSDGNDSAQASGSHPSSDRRPERSGRGQHALRPRGFPQSPQSLHRQPDRSPFDSRDNVVTQPTHNA